MLRIVCDASAVLRVSFQIFSLRCLNQALSIWQCQTSIPVVTASLFIQPDLL
jgi:hypothetical protein